MNRMVSNIPMANTTFNLHLCAIFLIFFQCHNNYYGNKYHKKSYHCNTGHCLYKLRITVAKYDAWEYDMNRLLQHGCCTSEVLWKYS